MFPTPHPISREWTITIFSLMAEHIEIIDPFRQQAKVWVSLTK